MGRLLWSPVRDGIGIPEHFPPRCLASENIACDVDENLWPDSGRRQNADPKLSVIAITVL